MRRTIILNLPSALLILLFLYAALMKLFIYEDFTSQLSHSPLLEQYGGLLAWLVPALEIGICILLILPGYRLLGFHLSFVLLLAFSGYILYVLKYAPYIPCACGGVLNTMGWSEHLTFNLIYAGIALAGILIHKNILLRERQEKPNT